MTTVATMLEMVERFNSDLIGLPIPERPTTLSFERGEFRLSHMREELTEIEEALSDNDLGGTADGLLDLVYVALGALIEMGITPGAAFEEVHSANMAKDRGTVARRPGSLGFDAVKPDGWKAPDLTAYLTVTRPQILKTYLMQAGKELRLEDYKDKVVTDWPRITGLPQVPVRRKPNPKILVLGYGRHGKDTVAEAIANAFSLRFTSSSLFCAEHVIMPVLGSLYETVEACFEDRHNHRDKWYEAIRAFNRPDAASLGRAIFEEHDIYCGLRSKAEFHALKNTGVFDVAIWVDRSDHEPPEDKSSCTVEPWMADYTLDNNGSLEDLNFNISQLMGRLLS